MAAITAIPTKVGAANPAPGEARMFTDAMRGHNLPALRRAALSELQINLGKLCNQACNHCHVDAGPNRTEIMTWETMEKILRWMRANNIERADITGGAPELNPHFRRFAEEIVSFCAAVTSRCNLTVLLEPGQEDLAEWYAARKIQLVCSLPCYSRENVDAQRGGGVFEKSIAALRQLNAAGYGKDPALTLDLVYNPQGRTLPPPQAGLEADYKTRLGADFGITFNRLLALANLPVNRFAHHLRRHGEYDGYLRLLADNFNPGTVAGLMCRHLLSVDWLGRVYDCDFNQMLEINAPVNGAGGAHLWDISAAGLEGKRIAVGAHCLGCTAGAGSSCGGTLV